MRLLNVDTLEFAEYHRDVDRPRYVIASHRWQEEEATFHEVLKKENTHKKGYKKVEAFAKYVQQNLSRVKWLWVDTCCIDKTNAAELSEAINLMFHWYRDAEVCVAYLVDVETTESSASFKGSQWFERGWTLQELVAPRTVIFLTGSWQVIGNKGASFHNYCETAVGPGLEANISARTSIPEKVLHDYHTAQAIDAVAKFKWIDGRQTSREEDMSYALYGILDVTPGINYGERTKGARARLQRAVRERDDRAGHATRFQQILDWLSPPDPKTNHEAARQQHEEQTGLWLVQSEQYQEWKSGVSPHLWMHGKAGCGKTILCSTAIKDVQAHCKMKPGTEFAMFYFSFSDNRKQSAVDLLRTLVAQLASRGPAFALLEQAYNVPNRSFLGKEDLEKILQVSIEAHDEVYLIMDALDECPEEHDNRQKVLELIKRLSSDAPNLRVLATSRESHDIATTMQELGAASISVEEQLVDADIRKYVSTQLRRDPRLSRFSRDAKAKIGEKLTTKAGGMFRWVDCQLQELKKLKITKPRVIDEALRALPTTLDETYERMLVAIDHSFRQDALTWLRWIAYAESPLRLSELVDAAVIDIETDLVDLQNRGGPEDALEVLHGLVITVQEEDEDDETDSDAQISSEETYKRRNGETNPGEANPVAKHEVQLTEHDPTVRLAHYSVKEYLESSRILDCDAREFHLDSRREHKFLAQSCLIYLQHYSVESGRTACREDVARDKGQVALSEYPTSEELLRFPLLEYAATSWHFHSNLQQPGDVSYEVSFLTGTDTLFNWVLLYYDLKDALIRPYDWDPRLGLLYASTLGLRDVVQKLLDAGVDVNFERRSDGCSALVTASYNSFEDIVQMLIDAGAVMGTGCGPEAGMGNRPLTAAISAGAEGVVRVLLDAGANVEAGNLLKDAAQLGHGNIVRMLLDAGADLETCPLDLLAYYGVNTLQVLLDAGASPNKDLPLAWAAYSGLEDVVQVLINAKSDPDHGYPLIITRVEEPEMTGINSRADFIAAFPLEVDGCPLEAAATSGKEKVVDRLLAAGADIDMGLRRIVHRWHTLDKLIRDGPVREYTQKAHLSEGELTITFGVQQVLEQMHNCERALEKLIQLGADLSQGNDLALALEIVDLGMIRSLLDACAGVNGAILSSIQHWHEAAMFYEHTACRWHELVSDDEDLDEWGWSVAKEQQELKNDTHTRMSRSQRVVRHLLETSSDRIDFNALNEMFIKYDLKLDLSDRTLDLSLIPAVHHDMVLSWLQPIQSMAEREAEEDDVDDSTSKRARM